MIKTMIYNTIKTTGDGPSVRKLTEIQVVLIYFQGRPAKAAAMIALQAPCHLSNRQ